MKRYIPVFYFFYMLCSHFGYGQQNIWKQLPQDARQKNSIHRNISKYIIFSLDEPAMQSVLSSAMAGGAIELPLPDGSTKAFKVTPNNLLPPVLAAKYPQIRTYDAIAIGEPGITAKLEYTTYGFHAMVYDGVKTCLIDPEENNSASHYVVRYKNDEHRSPQEMMACTTQGHKVLPVSVTTAEKYASKTMNGYQLRSYRLALACNHEYAQKVTGLAAPGKDQVLSKMVTTLNRVNGVYQRELSVSLSLIANEDTLIMTDSLSDPFVGYNENPSALISLNQRICDSFVGNDNYDIGHIFSTGAGGLSSVGIVCTQGFKAQSVTGSRTPSGDGFDIDYVAHEMGHEFGADHPFNNNQSGNCAGNAVEEFAYEPGSGSTIMAYAGICNPDDLQPHSDAYFCAISLKQISTFLTGAGNTCAVKTATSNKPVGLPAFNQRYFIPFLTPFELEAPAAEDSVTSTSITYCWEQADLGDFGNDLKHTSLFGPLFRSFTPDTSRLRVFPKMNKVFGDILDDSGHENAEGEKIPDASRQLNFRLTVRNIYNWNGCFVTPDDSVHLDVVNTRYGFIVTSQDTAGQYFLGGSTQIVTWEVAQTDLMPISAATVDIYLTADSGRSWPYFLGNFPNNGSANIILPKIPMTIEKSRIKVKGSGNVFFNVNREDFELINPDSISLVKIFPNPAHNTLIVVTGNKTNVQSVIFDAAGRKIWWGDIDGLATLDVTYWSRGMYIMKLIDAASQVTVRKFVLD